MTKKSRIKIVFVILFLVVFSIALYLHRTKSTLDLGWGKGLLSISERKYYSNRIERIIEYWGQKTPDKVQMDRDGWLDKSYNAYLVVDLDKRAMWIEENGQIGTENYIEFPSETNWTFYHVTPDEVHKLIGRTMLKIRGNGTNRRTPEKFYLVGSGNKGCLYFDIATEMSHGGYCSGSFVIPNVKIYIPTVSADKIYPSLIVTEDERKQYLDTLPDSNAVVVENEKIKAWNKIEKYLYMEIERQFPKNGYKLRNVSIEPGPDFSAARAQISVRKESFIDRIKGHRDSILIYQNIDHIGNDIWYAKSIPNPNPDPERIKENKPALDIEFLASPDGFIKGAKYKELLKKGREFQLATVIPESKWKTTLSNGTKFEFLGIHENTNSDTHWWGPDGSILDYIPNYNNEPYDRYFIDKIIYEVAWRLTPRIVSDVTLEGRRNTWEHQIINRYGYRYIIPHGVEGFSFDNRPQTTTFKAKIIITDWKIPLQITNKPGEINFLNKKKIILNPPEIENEQLIVKCFEERNVQLTEYKTDFAIKVNSGTETKTVSLSHYGRQWPHEVEEGMDVYTYIIKDYKIDQIEGVCFRYQPYSYVMFKNISLVPGQNQGFEIEVQEAEEK